MKRIKKIRNKHSLHPIFSYCLLIFAIIVLSGVLNLFNVTTTYNKISNNGTYVRELVSSQNLFSLHGLKIIFSNAVSNFASFTPLSMLIITLIGIGIMDKTGFLDSLFYILTRKTNKKIVTFVLSFPVNIQFSIASYCMPVIIVDDIDLELYHAFLSYNALF